MKEGNELHGTEHFQLWTLLAIRWLVLTSYATYPQQQPTDSAAFAGTVVPQHN